jgi:hypothetical protein
MQFAPVADYQEIIHRESDKLRPNFEHIFNFAAVNRISINLTFYSEIKTQHVDVRFIVTRHLFSLLVIQAVYDCSASTIFRKAPWVYFSIKIWRNF